MEVIRVEIKIVGLISGEDELSDIQHIAKIIVYKQRMKDLFYTNKNNTVIKEYISNYKKSRINKKMYFNHAQQLSVRGLI
jgi:hypothetical protein